MPFLFSIFFCSLLNGESGVHFAINDDNFSVCVFKVHSIQSLPIEEEMYSIYDFLELDDASFWSPLY